MMRFLAQRQGICRVVGQPAAPDALAVILMVWCWRCRIPSRELGQNLAELGAHAPPFEGASTGSALAGGGTRGRTSPA